MATNIKKTDIACLFPFIQQIVGLRDVSCNSVKFGVSTASFIQHAVRRETAERKQSLQSMKKRFCKITEGVIRSTLLVGTAYSLYKIFRQLHSKDTPKTPSDSPDSPDTPKKPDKPSPGKDIIYPRISYTLLPKEAVFFPSLQEIESDLSIRDVYQIVTENNHRLIGLIDDLAKKRIPIPKIGFSGQTEEALERILASKKSGSRSASDKIWVAGYDMQLDPITFTADLLSAAKLANCYSGEKNGGILICNIEQCVRYSSDKKLNFNTKNLEVVDKITNGVDPKIQESNRKFYSLRERKINDNFASISLAEKLEALAMDNKGDWLKAHASPEKYFFDRIKISEESLAKAKELPDFSSMAIPALNENLLSFNPSNFDKRVLAVVKNSKSEDKLYNRLSNPSNSPVRVRIDGTLDEGPQTYLRGRLMNELILQRIVSTAFKSLGFTEDIDQQRGEELRIKGLSLINSFDKVTRHPR